MPLTIPPKILAAFNEYGFDTKFFDLGKAKKTRKTEDWFAILFETDDGLVAVDFAPNSEGEWEVQNDYIGPFVSVSEFSNGRLTKTFF